MKKLIYSTLLTFLFFEITHNLQAQGEIPVSMYTGTPQIMLNLATVSDRDISESIGLTYNANGVNLDASVGMYGRGWTLTSGGSVTREVRGLPDDLNDPGGRTGWLYSANYSSGITSFNDLPASSCTQERTNQLFLTSARGARDTEPDFFSFQVGNTSGHFVFDDAGIIHTVPYQDVYIQPTYKIPSVDLTIIGWTIVVNNGTTYSLNTVCTTTKSITKDTSPPMEQLSFMDSEYAYYQSGASYGSSWLLSKAQSTSGAFLNYTYQVTDSSSSDLPINGRISLGFPVDQENYVLMTIHETVVTKELLKIETSAPSIHADFTAKSITITDSRRSTAPYRTFAISKSADGFLTGISEFSGNTCLPPYAFYYKPGYPSSETTGRDFWGYFNAATNGSINAPTSIPTIYIYPSAQASDRYRFYPIPGYSGTQVTITGDANRLPNASAMTAGTLARIQYPYGGEATLTYEPNTYWDAAASLDQLAGGLRIKSMTYFDGHSNAENIVKTFDYSDASGHSSGHLISRPTYTLPAFQYNNPTAGGESPATYSYSQLISASTDNLWKGLTLVTGMDVSHSDNTQGSNVGYTQVAVSRANSGKAVYNYYLPGGYGDASSGAWSPVATRFARPADCPSPVIVNQDETWSFPQFTNPYFDYERGLPWKKSEYNASGTLVRYTVDTYQYIYATGSNPKSIFGLSFELLANNPESFLLYGKYAMLTDVSKVVSSESVTTYDENNTSHSGTEISQFYYTSPYHKFLAAVKKTATDGTVYGTRMKYTLDYPYTGIPLDVPLLMIKGLKDAHRTGVIIENTSSIKHPGGNVMYTGGSVLKFDPFSPGTLPLLKYQYALRALSPIDSATFSPSGVTSNAFTYDSRYDLVQTINRYDLYNLPLSSVGEDRVTKGTLWGFNQTAPTAQIQGAAPENIAFSDFETSTASSFTVTNGFYGTGRTGTNGVHPYATLSGLVNLPANTTAYSLSFWVKTQNASTSVPLIINIKNTSGTVLLTTTASFTTTGTVYQRFSYPIPWTTFNLPAQFVVEVHGSGFTAPSGGSPGLLPLLDDVLLCPTNASVSSQTYDFPYGANSVTDAAGTTVYTVYDGLGRKHLALDQDRNVRERIAYDFARPTAGITAGIDPVTVYAYEPITFHASDQSPCLLGTPSYFWSYDGSAYVAGTQYSAPQTYQPPTGFLPPPHTVKLKVTLAGFSDATYTFSFPVLVRPLQVSICAGGIKSYNWITSTWTSWASGCMTAPPVPWVAFQAAVSNDYGHGLTYQWLQISDQVTWWNNVGGGTATYSQQKVLSGEHTFYVKCHITTNDGREADSNILAVTIQN